jgi:hypothetical protein
MKRIESIILADHAASKAGFQPFMGYYYRVDLTNEIEHVLIGRIGSLGTRQNAVVMGRVVRMDEGAFFLWPSESWMMKESGHDDWERNPEPQLTWRNVVLAVLIAFLLAAVFWVAATDPNAQMPVHRRTAAPS